MSKEIEIVITPKQIAKAINDILDENENLQERISYLERSNNRREETIELERKENLELHNKIDKAINLVNNEIYKNRCNCSYCNSYYLKEMKNILKDSDVNEYRK